MAKTYNLADIDKALRGKTEEEALGGKSPKAYEGVFKKAFGRLGQPTDILYREGVYDPGNLNYSNVAWTPEEYRPGKERRPTEERDRLSRGDFVISGTQELAESFIDRFFLNTGQIPTARQVSEFVGNTLTEDWAKSYAEGAAPREKNMALAGTYIEDRELTGTPTVSTGAGEATKTLEALQDKLYDQYLGMAGDYTKRQFAPLRTRAIEEEAAIGRLRSPVSAAPSSPIQQIGHEEANALSDTIRDLLKSRAEGTVDLYKFGESLGAGERRAKEAGRQFREELAFNREKFGRQSEQQDEANRIAREIGKLQAGGKKRDAFDYLDLALRGAGTVASGYAAFK